MGTGDVAVTEVLLTPTEAVVSRRVFDRLHECSSSMPTGPSVGRYWKRQRNWRDPSSGWLLAVVEPGPIGAGYDLVRWRDLQVVDP